MKLLFARKKAELKRFSLLRLRRFCLKVEVLSLRLQLLCREVSGTGLSLPTPLSLPPLSFSPNPQSNHFRPTMDFLGHSSLSLSSGNLNINKSTHSFQETLNQCIRNKEDFLALLWFTGPKLIHHRNQGPLSMSVEKCSSSTS